MNLSNEDKQLLDELCRQNGVSQDRRVACFYR